MSLHPLTYVGPLIKVTVHDKDKAVSQLYICEILQSRLHTATYDSELKKKLDENNLHIYLPNKKFSEFPHHFDPNCNSIYRDFNRTYLDNDMEKFVNFYENDIIELKNLYRNSKIQVVFGVVNYIS